jgi:hypothetical protein
MRIKLLIFIPLYCVWVMAALAIVFGVFTAGLPPGELPFPAVIVYLVVILIPVWLFTKWLNADPAWVKKVEADGKPAKATILSVKNTGMVINNTVAVVKLQLRVEPPGEAPFEVSQDKQISMVMGLGGYSAGARVNVKYDPDHKNHVVILSDSETAADYGARSGSGGAEAFNSSSDVTQQLEELAKLHKSGELSDSEFAAAKKKLLG